MQPLYLARIEDLGRGDLVQIDWAACHHVAPLRPDFLPRLGLVLQAKILDFKSRGRCRGCGAKGRAVVAKCGKTKCKPKAGNDIKGR